jgi:hypothetical protein
LDQIPENRILQWTALIFRFSGVVHFKISNYPQICQFVRFVHNASGDEKWSADIR